jgi:DNA-binding transcriptional LysR family regulator
MDRFQAIVAFAKVVETGGFARAAERLDVSVSAVSRHVAELEAHLDARLLNRTTRRLSLTESGRVFYERCVQLLADLEEAEESATLQAVKPRGTLRLTCGVIFGELHLASAIGEFLTRYPEMRFDVELSDRAVDLVEEGFDAAVRIGPIGSQNLVGRKIGETRLVCCASPSYLKRHGEPKRPEDLVAHACLTYEYSPWKNVWPFRDHEGRDRGVRIAGPVHANSGQFLVALAAAGVAIAVEPDFIVGQEVRSGRLVPILRRFALPPASIYVVYPSRRHLSAKVRMFAAFLLQRFIKPEWASTESRGHPKKSAPFA